MQAASASHLEAYWDSTISSWTCTKEITACFFLILNSVGKYWVWLWSISSVHRGVICTWAERQEVLVSAQTNCSKMWVAGGCLLFLLAWRLHALKMLKCFSRLVVILSVFYIAFSPIFPISFLLQFSNGRFRMLHVTWFHDTCICIYMRCLVTLLRLCWTSLFRSTQHSREVSCHYDAWGLNWAWACYSRSPAYR